MSKGMNLFQASNQWKMRPPDERFGNLQEMFDVCKGYADSAAVADVLYSDLRVEAQEGDVRLTSKAGSIAYLSHWAFGQLARLVGAPADYLRALPATLSVQNLNHGLKNKVDNSMPDRMAKLLFHQNGHLLLRAITSDIYTRIWNYEIVERLLPLQALGWRVPPARPAYSGQPGTRPATEADVLGDKGFGLSVSVGDLIAPAGLYASDHDMFAFLVNEKNRIADGSEHGLAKGFFVENSEVGGGSFKITTFLYRHVCGNHIVWDAKGVTAVNVRHIGAADDKAWAKLAVEVKNYSDSSVSDLEAKIVKAKRFEIAAKKEDVLDFLFGKRIAPRKTLELAYATAEINESVDGSPRSAWGMAQGLTRISQENQYADQRTTLDRAAGNVLQIAF